MTETARMYGGSLYDLAAEEGLEARIPVSYTHLDVYKRQIPHMLTLISEQRKC